MNKATKRDRILLVAFFIFLVGLYIYRTKKVQEQVRIDKFIPRTTSGPKEVSGVPLVIYRSWITNSLPIRMNNTVMKTIALTPEFDNFFFSDEDCYNFIRDNFEPDVLNAYICLKPAAFKSDLWRYCILYKKGGMYLDIKLELKLPLYDILKKYPKIFVQDMMSFPKEKNPLTTETPLWNGVMSSPPGNPVFKACIDEIVESCKNRDYKQHVLDITGPYQLGRMVDKYEGLSFSRELPFRHHTLKQIHYFDDLFTTEYEGYRDDQKRLALVKVKYYGELYKERDVFDSSVIFS